VRSFSAARVVSITERSSAVSNPSKKSGNGHRQRGALTVDDIASKLELSACETPSSVILPPRGRVHEGVTSNILHANILLRQILTANLR
jgi:hypothetical protein